MYALHRCSLTDQLIASKAMWVTSIISLTFSINLPRRKSNTLFDPLRWTNSQRKREQLCSDLETPSGYTLVGVVLDTSQRLRPNPHIPCVKPHQIRVLDILLVPLGISGVPFPLS